MNKQSKETLYSQWSLLKPIILAAIFVVAWCAVSVVNSHADITRGCRGTLSIHTYGVEGKKTNSYTKIIDTFDGRGACKNATQANTCRKRAKDNIFRCADELWENRWNLIGDPNINPNVQLPYICAGRSTGVLHLGPFKTNPFGQHFDIKHEIEYEACCQLQPKADSMKIKLTVHSQGDKGCGAHKDLKHQPWGETRTLINDYYADCKKLRVENRICGGKRTGG